MTKDSGHPGDIEIFVRHSSEGDIVRWLTEVLGPFHQIETTPTLYTSMRSEASVSLILQSGLGDGTYTSVMLAPNVTPWPTDVAFARAAFAALGQEVRCDPGALSSKAWHWLEICRAGEALVVWDGPKDKE